jgi:AcrR family transcriptional regulator
MTKKITTKDKILNAAEFLFANSGFAETSMRLITTKAGVNLASINYHFGSKKDLIKEVLDRYLAQLIPEVNQQLKALFETNSEPRIDQVFACFKQPLLNLEQINSGGTVCFLKLLGRGYVDVQGHLRGFITGKYREEIRQIQTSFHRCMPHLSEEELFWRIHLTLGTSVFTLAASEALIDIVKADFNHSVSTEDMLDKILPFVAAGFSK